MGFAWYEKGENFKYIQGISLLNFYQRMVGNLLEKQDSQYTNSAEIHVKSINVFNCRRGIMNGDSINPNLLAEEFNYFVEANRIFAPVNSSWVSLSKFILQTHDADASRGDDFVV
ncbi:MAG: hypothetical protein HC910_06465 [Spirulinaceae cyanobacterium SM2_1_0]|nr:hypothetical protein [Spirulinaceae cyanobacterium SM2_1_0]